MLPYNIDFIKDKIASYNKKIKPAVSGDYEIRLIDGLKGIVPGYMYEEKIDFNYPILELQGTNHSWMRLTPLEVEATYQAIKRANGKVGVVGLGLGYMVQELIKKKNVKKVVVYEIEKEVIDLYYKSFKKHPKVKIIHGDAFAAKEDSFDFFFVDIYEYKLTSKVAEDYKKFMDLHDIYEYSFFGMEHFLLSCRYEEIVWVYIPEEWMEMSKKISEALEESGKIKFYKQLDEKLVSQVLADFKKVLNEDC